MRGRKLGKRHNAIEHELLMDIFPCLVRLKVMKRKKKRHEATETVWSRKSTSVSKKKKEKKKNQVHRNKFKQKNNNNYETICRCCELFENLKRFRHDLFNTNQLRLDFLFLLKSKINHEVDYLNMATRFKNMFK